MKMYDWNVRNITLLHTYRPYSTDGPNILANSKLTITIGQFQMIKKVTKKNFRPFLLNNENNNSNMNMSFAEMKNSTHAATNHI